MASNSGVIADGDGDYEDWIELYNHGSESVSLEDWGLSDDYDDPFRWVFPAGVEIEPGGFLLVWASGKDRSGPGGELHTNFRIAMAGEEVLLTDPSGTRVDELAPLEIPTDISRGRWPDGTGDWFFFDEPTPGAANTSARYTEILDPPAFSRPGGFYAETLELELSHPDPEAAIVYTLDGSLPAVDNLEGTAYYYKNSYPEEPGQPFGEFLVHTYRSRLYQAPLAVGDRSAEDDRLTQISSTWHFSPYYFPDSPVRKGTVVRARAFKEGAISGPAATHTYFINSSENLSNLPVVSIALQEDALFDYYSGIYVAGVRYDDWRQDHPDASSGWRPANYHRRGRQWEYPAHIELFPPGTSSSAWSQGLGLRIHGSTSRAYPNKSLRMYARNLYGESDFEYPVFPDLACNNYKRLILRNSGNDHRATMFRDAAIQTMVSHLNFDTQAYRPAVLFINGEYWGIHNFRERYDRHYLSRVYGVDPDNLDILEGDAQVQQGDNEHYKAMLDFIGENDVALRHNYEYVKTLMDVENYIDYQAAQIFVANTVWAGFNIRYWRLKTDAYQPGSPPGEDGRWRWLMFDTDLGFSLFPDVATVEHNTLAASTAEAGPGLPDPPWSTFLLRSLMRNPDFAQSFIIRFADLLNTAFLPEITVGVIDTLKAEIEAEIPEHTHRWKQPDSWEYQVNRMIDFAARRPAYQRTHLRDYFDLDGEVNLTLDVSGFGQGHVRVNTIEIRAGTPGVSGQPYPWTGVYFSGVPIELEAIPAAGYEFSHWEGDGLSSVTSPVVEITPTADLSLEAHFRRSAQPGLLYFWMFDGTMPNDTPLEEVEPVYAPAGAGLLTFDSALSGYPFSSGDPQWRKASMERRNSPTGLNYRPEGNRGIDYGESDMRGLQVRQPFTGDGGENTLVFHLPTTGYEEIVFRLAARDEGAAGGLVLDYSVAGGAPEWTVAGLDPGETGLVDEYRLYELDFSAVAAVNRNPDFRIRVRFSGEDMAADEGGRVTFNNISLEGRSAPGTARRPWIHDYDGDGTSDIAVFRPSSGLWAVRDLTRAYFGSVGDLPVPGDYSGDGTTDIAVFRPLSGLWAVRGVTRAYFGGVGDTPVAGDYSGSGSADIGIYRESSGLWAVRGVTRAYFGALSDQPVPGYYTPVGRKSIGIYRPAAGLWAVRGVTRLYFGSGEDQPVPGDYSGDGLWSPAVFRPSTGLWAARGSTRVYFGDISDDPVPGGYSGEGRDYPGVFRSSSGLWAVRGITRLYFGSASDLPTAR